MPTFEEWALYGGLVWNVINTVLAVVLFWYSHRNATRATLAAEKSAKVAEKYSERAAIVDDLEMYQDIAAGNFWGWNPWTVPVGANGYDQWSLWRERCIRYAPRISDVTYTEFARLLGKKKEDKGGERWDPVIKGVTIEAKRQLAILQDRLAKLNAR